MVLAPAKHPHFAQNGAKQSVAAFIMEINLASFGTQHKIGAKGVHLSWLHQTQQRYYTFFQNEPQSGLPSPSQSQFTFEEQNLGKPSTKKKSRFYGHFPYPPQPLKMTKFKIIMVTHSSQSKIWCTPHPPPPPPQVYGRLGGSFF